MASGSGGIEAALSKIDKAFGKDAVRRIGDEADRPIDVVPSGSIALDLALGIGGFPRGKMVEIYGPYSSGKTTIALHAIANAQKKGGLCAFIDAEFALDPKNARNIGVDTDELLVCQPETGEQGLEIVDTLVRSGDVSVIVVDSVAALVPRAEVEGDMGDAHVGRQARLIGQACRKMTYALGVNNTLLIWINQLRQNIGVTYGSNETVPGGKSLGFYCSQVLDVRKIETLKDSDGNATGSRTKVKVAKNKVAPPLRLAEFDLIYGVGISRESELIDIGAAKRIIVKSGSWYKYNDSPIGQGKENARQFLIDNPAIAADIEGLIKDA